MPPKTPRHTGESYEPPVSVRRKTFDVVLWRKPLAAAICYEGYSPTNDTVEPDVFDLFDVQAHPGNVPGTGTRIVRAALEEARLRGYAKGRSYLLNARMVTIMSRIQTSDEIAGLKFFPASTTPTDRLLESEAFFGVTQAADYLNQPFNPAVGIRPLDCVFRITEY